MEIPALSRLSGSAPFLVVKQSTGEVRGNARPARRDRRRSTPYGKKIKGISVLLRIGKGRGVDGPFLCFLGKDDLWRLFM
eukprot:1251102-Amorphochlora_amoeboformis.AAC.1